MEKLDNIKYLEKMRGGISFCILLVQIGMIALENNLTANWITYTMIQQFDFKLHTLS